MIPSKVVRALDELVTQSNESICYTWEGIKDVYDYIYLYRLPRVKLSMTDAEIIRRNYLEGVAYMTEVGRVVTKPSTEKATFSTFVMPSVFEYDDTEDLSEYFEKGGYIPDDDGK